MLLAGAFCVVSAPSQARQVGALPFRKRRGKVEILLITSRETKRWIIPKGWPMDGLQNYNAARREALEEAGIVGRVGKIPIGHFQYDKRLKNGDVRRCHIYVYKLEVKTMLRNWHEKHERQRRWFTTEKAAALVDEVGLKAIILNVA